VAAPRRAARSRPALTVPVRQRALPELEQVPPLVAFPDSTARAVAQHVAVWPAHAGPPLAELQPAPRLSALAAAYVDRP
jgi:hypothetical protein